MNSKITKNDAILELGKPYKFAGYDWTACELVNNGRTAVIQSHGVTSGAWPGYTMPQFGNGNDYASDIDSQNISDYDDKMRALYDSIKDAEDKSAPYGKGLYLVSKEKVGFKEWGEPGSGNYWAALKEAATDHNLFEACINAGAWLGTDNGNSGAWYVYSFGGVHSIDYNQFNDYVVAPAFNLDLSKVEIVGDEIMIKAMCASIENTILLENPDATSVQKQMFLHYGLYLEEKNEEIERYVVVHTGKNIFRTSFLFHQII